MSNAVIISLMVLNLALALAMRKFVKIMDARIEKVAQYRTFLIEIIHEKAEIDVYQRRDWRWRYRKFNEVSYREMVIKPWKKLDSFYPDKTFLQ